MTVRTPVEAGGTLAGGFDAPAGIPLHVPIFTLQNSTRDWFKPMEFLPERWMAQETEAEALSSPVVDQTGRKVTRLEQPKCPFLAKMASDSASGAGAALGLDVGAGAYDGLGFEEDSLSFFPFSAGVRACPGKHLALQVRNPGRAFSRIF
jgi:cytochrome P450